MGGLQAGGGVVLGLLAHDALLGQRDRAACVGLLVVVVGLRLGQRCFGGLDHRLDIDGGAARFRRGSGCSVSDGLAELPPVAGSAAASAGLARRLQVVALDDGDQLAGFDVLAFIDRQRLDAPLNPAAHHHLVGVHRADQLPDRRMGATE